MEIVKALIIAMETVIVSMDNANAILDGPIMTVLLVNKNLNF